MCCRVNRVLHTETHAHITTTLVLLSGQRHTHGPVVTFVTFGSEPPRGGIDDTHRDSHVLRRAGHLLTRGATGVGADRWQRVDSGHHPRSFGRHRARGGGHRHQPRDRCRDHARHERGRRVRGVAAATRHLPCGGAPRRLPAVCARAGHRRRPGGGRSQRHAAGRRCRAGGHRVGRAFVAAHGRRAARSDHSQRRLHRASAGDEHRWSARPDRVHVPDAGRAVGGPLGQRHGRPGLRDDTPISRACRSPAVVREKGETSPTASRSKRSSSSRSRPAARR